MFKDLIGENFGRLKVIKLLPKRSKRRDCIWFCLCNCGKYTKVKTYSLKNGDTKSCGCYNLEKTIERSTKHGMAHTREYQAWAHMKTRCLNKNSKDYKHYGGRGITLCKSWYEFKNFYTDMGNCPNGYEIDRIDNDKGYYKKNCRWVSHKKNTRNTRKNRLITFKGKSLPICEWSEKTGIKQDTIRMRLNHGWNARDILTAPLYKRPEA